jgi:hypothetical protein
MVIPWISTLATDGGQYVKELVHSQLGLVGQRVELPFRPLRDFHAVGHGS